MSIARVALAVPLPHLFDYAIPDQLKDNTISGVRVKVPFGHRQTIGIVVEISEHSEIAPESLKNIEAVLDETSLFPTNLWRLIIWAAQYYHHPIGEVLFHALPVALRKDKPAKIKNSTLLPRPTDQGEFSYIDSSSGCQTQSFTPKKEPTNLVNPCYLVLNEQQQLAIDLITHHITQFCVWLLEGVTGSGKTEIYLSTLIEVVKAGQQALILVPEISLTPQTVDRFRRRFRVPVDVLHSGLSSREKLSVYLRAQKGETTIVIGTRSALFTPFKKIGLIVVDEEHDSSYKQTEGFRYHARDLAIVKAKLENIPIILGSATPSLESLYNSQRGKYRYLKLTKRAGNATLAEQHLIDIKGLELTAGLSRPLILRMREHLAKNQQVLLFLNRRGYAPRLICHDCGLIDNCTQCDKAYTYHQKQYKLICHHCNSTRPIPKQCHNCGSTHIRSLGFGTEQLEQKLKYDFTDIPISRLDRDTLYRKGALESYLAKINQGNAHILVGTQILTKGHHFSNVTLVGILDIDSILYSADFRATERFAQIYTQVSGRAGRESKSGEVVIQTYFPEHPLLNLLLRQDYRTFADQTLQERETSSLPPFSYHVILRAVDSNNLSAPTLLQRAYQWLTCHYHDKTLFIQKPIPSILSKKSGHYRWQLLIQHSRRQSLQIIIGELYRQLQSWNTPRTVRWFIDIDPIEA